MAPAAVRAVQVRFRAHCRARWSVPSRRHGCARCASLHWQAARAPSPPGSCHLHPECESRREGIAAQEGIHRFGDVSMDGEFIARLDLDQHIEGGRGAALEHGLLRAAAAGFLVRERDRFDAADQVGQGGVEQQIFERLAVRRADELHAALGDGARGLRLPARARSRR